MKRFSANYIFSITQPPIKNGVIVLNDTNTIIDIIDPKGDEKEFESMEFHNGIIVPGFVNAHCHLELSHLDRKLKQTNGISEFVSQIREHRKADDSEIKNSIKKAISAIGKNGTVAVADICNTIDTISEKLESDIYFHNFIEIFGLDSSSAGEKIRSSSNLLNSFQMKRGSSSLTPHSTYSISDELWKLIHDELTKTPSIVSIHYGESIQEYTLLKDHSGPLAENFKALGIPLNLPNCSNPFEVVKRFIPKQSKVLFIHNTFSSKEEVVKLIDHFDEPYFVLCPSSNLFIEGKLPDLPMLIAQGAILAIGTDSLASSNTLSVLDQIQILTKKFPSITFHELIQWATFNGAKALNVDSIYGSLEIGKTPGLNLITDFDFKLMKPTAKSRVRRLV